MTSRNVFSVYAIGALLVYHLARSFGPWIEGRFDAILSYWKKGA